MRRRGQSGMTLVELLVSLAVTSILLVGLSGVFFNVTARYQRWIDRLNTASTGSGLAASLQADSHRYPPCGNVDNVTTLKLCPADTATDERTWAVRYVVSGRAPYVITREVSTGGSPTFMVRSADPVPPFFWAECIPHGATVSGHIHVYNLRTDDGAGNTTNPSHENFSVYYVAPWRDGC
jgi:prepilin-type N-terminal cleavage/methylation domain-containing protein